MDANIELLTHINNDANMGATSVTKLLEGIRKRENKIKTVMEDELKGYETFIKKSKQELKKRGKHEEKESLMAKMGVTMGVKKEVMMDNSDAALAQMVTEGLTMGVVNMESKIKDYKKEADESVMNLAKEFLKFQQNEIEKLKKYM